MNWLLWRISCGCRQFWSQTITDLHLFLDLIVVTSRSYTVTKAQYHITLDDKGHVEL